MKVWASAEGHLSASGGCSTLLAIAMPASPRITWFGSSPLGRSMNTSNVSWCALRFLTCGMIVKGSWVSAGTSFGFLELALSGSLGCLWVLLGEETWLLLGEFSLRWEERALFSISSSRQFLSSLTSRRWFLRNCRSENWEADLQENLERSEPLSLIWKESHLCYMY